MTSPTTSADAVTERNIAYAIAEYKIWGGQLTPDQAMEDSDFRADCYALAEYIAAALAQHAEAGAVVEWRWVDERGRAMTKWKAGEPPPMGAVSDEKGTMRVEIRPAQPASQQGEVTGVSTGDTGTTFFRKANPTGDKVRELIESAQPFAAEPNNSWRAQRLREAIAALDQEKNDGR